MHDPLRAIQDLVFHQLPPAQVLLLHAATPGLLWQQAQCRIEELRAVFVRSVCCLPTKKEKKAMVQTFHATAVLLCNQLNDYATIAEVFPLQQESKQEFTAAYRDLRNRLYESLSVLDQFPTLVNNNQALPTHAIEAARPWAQEALQQLGKNWQNKTDPELLRVLGEPLQDLINGETEVPTSVRSLAYLRKLVRQTVKLAKTAHPDTGMALIHLLIRLNHNSDAFIQYASQRLIPNELDEGTAAYLLQYRRLLLQIQQLHPRPELALYPDLPTCQSRLCAFLQQEIGLLETYPQNPSRPSAAGAVATHTNKPLFKSCLTMSQLAVMLRWCSQTGILQSDTIEHLFKAVAKSVATAGKGSFKASSLQTEYYELDPTAVTGAKNFVIQLLNEARKYPR